MARGLYRWRFWITAMASLLLVAVVYSPVLVLDSLRARYSYVAVTYDPGRFTAQELAAIQLLAANTYIEGEFCDPLPCWVVFQVTWVRQLVGPVPVVHTGGGVYYRHGPILAVQETGPNGEPMAGRETVTCPAGSFIIEGQWANPWPDLGGWMAGRRNTLCLSPDPTPD